MSPLYLAPEAPADDDGGGGAGDDAGADDGAGAGDPEPTFARCSFECFSCSTNFFHLLTSSAAARAMSLLEFERSFPTKTPALVAYDQDLGISTVPVRSRLQYPIDPPRSQF